MSEDPIALLLPDATTEDRSRARRLTTFLRLLASDARGESAGSAQVVLARASQDLEQARVTRLAQALEDLLRAHLEHELGRDEYSWFGSQASSTREAWSLVEELRPEWDWLPGVPEPGETTLSLAERLFAAFERLVGSTPRVALWRARLCLLTDGVEAGRVSLRALAESSSAASDSATRCELVAGVAECLLTEGAVNEARAWLASQTDLFGKSLRLAQLATWARVLSGECCAGVRGAGPLPAPLSELRERVPTLTACLPGTNASVVRGERWRPLNEPSPLSRREGLGALVLVVFCFRAGRARPVRVDVVPALQGGLEDWLQDREIASTTPDDPQHALVAQLEPFLLDTDAARNLSLGGDLTRRLALEPILDDEGEVCGWLHLEFAHLAHPSRRGLRELAASWRDKVLLWNGQLEQSGRMPTETLARESRPACSLTFEALMDSAGLKLKRRRWWGFEVQGQEPVLVAEGGSGLATGGARVRPGRALRRALAAAGVVQFEDGCVGLALHPESGSGVVVPIRASDKLLGCVVVESARRNDFAAGDLERLVSAASNFATPLRAARFSDWHAERWCVGVRLPAIRPAFGAFASRIASAARATSPLCVSGPEGSGKRVLARWILFESGRGADAYVELSCGDAREAGALERAARDAAGGSLLMSDLERASPQLQKELLTLLERDRGRRCRVYVLTRVPLRELVEMGVLRGDLARVLDRIHFAVPALADRRRDIPELARFLVSRIAHEEGVPSVQLSDEVLAFLWRQAWPGNVRELEGVLTRLVLACVGSTVELDLIHTTLDGKYVSRLPSRRPRVDDLIAALCTTRTLGGRINKTRAAAYLGWDPDTLVLRLCDAKISEEALPESEPWAFSVE